jgi:hypothetical protein
MVVYGGQPEKAVSFDNEGLHEVSGVRGMMLCEVVWNDTHMIPARWLTPALNG